MAAPPYKEPPMSPAMQKMFDEIQESGKRYAEAFKAMHGDNVRPMKPAAQILSRGHFIEGGRLIYREDS